MSKRLSDALGVARGVQLIARAALKNSEKKWDKAWQTCSVKETIEKDLSKVSNMKLDTGNLQMNVQDAISRATVVSSGAMTMTKLVTGGIIPGYCGQPSTSDELLKDLDRIDPEAGGKSDHSAYTARLPPRPMPKKMEWSKPELSSTSQESRVPSSRGLGLSGSGSTNENVVQSVLGDENPFLTEANAERIVKTLCRVRGAALKLGQMLSLQEGSMISPELSRILERVRNSADFMPASQVEKCMKKEFGPEWRLKFKEFDEKPFAAASIGQVHRAVLESGEEAAMKIQYPGVAQSIDSDINNLVTVLNLGNLFPKGLYLEEFVKVARKELALECDYIFEASAHKKFAEFLKDRDDFYVPKVFDDYTTKSVFTSELIQGVALDKCADMDQETRDWIGTRIIELCLVELCTFKYMQTDPNWSNFFFDQSQSRIILLDFGASRAYDHSFVEQYLKILKAARDKRLEDIITHSVEIGFLTGYETKVMVDAHTDAVMIMGEVLNSDLFDFGEQRITSNVQHVLPVMLKHRLTPPPEEIYSLHRKMSGAFLLCAKLRSRVPCRDLFDQVYDQFHRTNVGHNI